MNLFLNETMGATYLSHLIFIARYLWHKRSLLLEQLFKFKWQLYRIQSFQSYVEMFSSTSVDKTELMTPFYNNYILVGNNFKAKQ